MHTTLKNKITLVTGVSSGIGREIAQLLAERGARVFGAVREVTVNTPAVALPGREARSIEPNAPLSSCPHVRQEVSQTISTGLIL